MEPMPVPAQAFVVPPPAPKSFFALVADAAASWRRQWHRLLLLTGLNVLVVALVAAAFFAAGSLAWNGAGLIRIVIAIAVVLIALLVAVWLTLRLMIAYLSVIVGWESGTSIGAAWATGRGRAHSYFWMTFLAYLVVVGGYLLLVVPGVIWGVSFWILPWVFAAEGLKGREALVRARQWVKGDGWRVLLHIFALGLFFGILGLPIGMGERFLAGNKAALYAWQAVWGLVQIVLVTPLAACFSHAVYMDLRHRKEASLQPLPKQKTWFTVAFVLGIIPFAVMLASSGYVTMKFIRSATIIGGPSGGMSADEARLDALLEDLGPATATAPVVVNADTDADADGLNASTERRLGTDPADVDSDDDGLADGDEVRVFLTSPTRASTAGSPYDDGTNLRNGYNPLVPGQLLSESEIAAIRSRIGRYGLHATSEATIGDRYR